MCPVLYGAVLLGGLTAPAMFFIIYLIRCELHPFYGVLPIVCDHYNNFPGFDGILIKIVSGMYIWLLGSSIFASGLVSFAPMFFFWFYGSELSTTMMYLRTIYEFIEIFKYEGQIHLRV